MRVERCTRDGGWVEERVEREEEEAEDEEEGWREGGGDSRWSVGRTVLEWVLQEEHVSST